MIVAWVLVRYKFPGKRMLDAIVDLPFALPTAVAGIALSTLYAPKGWIGSLFSAKGPLNLWIDGADLAAFELDRRRRARLEDRLHARPASSSR